MAVIKRRNRSVNFRLSEDEYELLRRVCMQIGARSLSDLARSAVSHLIGQNIGPCENSLEGAVHRLDLQVAELSRQLRRLARLVEGDLDTGEPSKRDSA